MELKDLNEKFIDDVVEQIVFNFGPKRIILFSRKNDLVGKCLSFKLCILLDCKDKMEAERQIYINTDSEIPFDIIVYTPEEFESNLDIVGSFASKINKTGIVVYG